MAEQQITVETEPDGTVIITYGPSEYETLRLSRYEAIELFNALNHVISKGKG